MKIIRVPLSASEVKAPSFATGSAEYRDPSTGKLNVRLATEQHMRHVVEETIHTADTETPTNVIRELPFVLLLGDEEKGTLTCSSRTLSHRVADSQIQAVVLQSGKSDVLKKMRMRSDLIAQYLDPVSLLGGYWFSYWKNGLENSTVASAALFEAVIDAYNVAPMHVGATKFSRFTSTQAAIDSIAMTSKKKSGLKASDAGFGMIPASGESTNRYAVGSGDDSFVELRITDVRESGFNRAVARGQHSATIELNDALLDLMFARVSNQPLIPLRAKCSVAPLNVSEINPELEKRVESAVSNYLEARTNDFDNNPACRQIREFFESVDESVTVSDPQSDSRPNARVWGSMAIAQDGKSED